MKTIEQKLERNSGFEGSKVLVKFEFHPVASSAVQFYIKSCGYMY